MLTGIESLAALGGDSGAIASGPLAATPRSFDEALQAAGASGQGVADQSQNPISGLLSTFDHLNAEAGGLHATALQVQTAGHDMTPGEMIMLTMRCNEFLFHCELSTNIASRSSDGLQQLFREQD